MRRVCRAVLVLGGVLLFLAPLKPVQAATVQYDFNWTGSTGSSVKVTMGLNSSVTTPNHAFSLADVASFSVQFTSPAYTASGTALPATLSGQMSNGPSPIFSSLFVNDSLTSFTPSFSGTNNFQFYGLNGQSWSMATAGFPPIGTTQVTGTGTWTVAAVPVPAAVWLFGSGLAAMAGWARRKMYRASMS